MSSLSILQSWIPLISLLTTIMHCQNTFNAYSSMNQFTCTGATSADVCNIHCVEESQMNLSFNCGKAGTCNFYCSAPQCLQSGLLNASNSNTLLLQSNSPNCLTQANIHLPNNGDAIIQAQSQQALQNTNIQSGINTQNIIINCADDTIHPQSCKQFNGMWCNSQGQMYDIQQIHTLFIKIL